MNVKIKTLLIEFISFITLIIITFTIYHFIIMRYINNIESKKIDNSFKTVDMVINREELGMENTVEDWSNWDDTYNFILGKNREEFLKDNFQGSTMKQLNLNFMIFADLNGDVIYSMDNELEGISKDTIIKKIFNSSKDSNTLITFNNNDKVHSGILGISGKVFIVTSSKITTTDEKSNSNGTLIIGRFMDSPLNNYINSIVNGNIAFGEASNLKSSQTNIQKNNRYITAYKKMKDAEGNMSIAASINIKRDEYILSNFYFSVFLISFSIASVLITIASIYSLNKHILKRLRLVNDFIDEVALTKNTNSRLEVNKKDEITNIGNSVNNMLCKLDDAYEEMRIMDERFKMVMEATNDGYVDYNLKTNEYFISSEWRNIFGYDKRFNILAKDGAEVSNKSLKKLNDKLKMFINSNGDYFEDEYEIVKPSGENMWILHRGKIAERDSEGRPVRIISTLIDITERKKYEEELAHLSYWDKLTNLKNAAYMEKKFSELKEHNYSIIVGDINGLKIVNDTFGHKEGDKLICKFGDVLKTSCSEDDIISRWSGDEFVILIIDKESSYVSNLIEKVKNECEKVTGFEFKMNIALGSAEKSEKLEPEEVMNLAEERMYRSKLTEKSSPRNSVIVSLEKTLYEKNRETEEHTMRIKNLSIQLGKKMNLSLDKLNELELLSLLHDIGKIGIPENILTKPGKLTEDEWIIMKGHTEIGCRIAKATPELSHVANEILSHHEKYDGTGYPQGLKGEDIPVLSRIINIVDSFDVMTHKRIYKDASSIDYAVEELKRCSGSQFDPEITIEFIELLKEDNVV